MCQIPDVSIIPSSISFTRMGWQWKSVLIHPQNVSTMNKYRLITCFFPMRLPFLLRRKNKLGHCRRMAVSLRPGKSRNPRKNGLMEYLVTISVCQVLCKVKGMETMWHPKRNGWQTNTNEAYGILTRCNASFREEKNLRYPNNFQPQKHYVGVAWYKKVIDIGKKALEGEEIILFLERVHWESTLWVNGKKVGNKIR